MKIQEVLGLPHQYTASQLGTPRLKWFRLSLPYIDRVIIFFHVLDELLDPSLISSQ
jgi:hypothetical protein